MRTAEGTERRRRGIERRRADARLRQLDDILAGVCHDLRGPLSAINIAIDALAQADVPEASRVRYVDAIRRAVRRAERFLADLVDVAHIESGTFKVDPRPTPIASLLEEAAQQHEEAARDAGNWLAVEIDDDVGSVMADRDRLLQALDQLISNALRYARGTGAVSLKAELAPARDQSGRAVVRIWVIDRGPGVPGGEVDHLFERRRPTDGDRHRRAGLGLLIARGIAEAHHGTARVASSPGGGARFCVEVPSA
jgi:signal transduction histidine kinase